MKLREGRGPDLQCCHDISLYNTELTVLLNKAGYSTPEELALATQVQGPVLPIIREKPAAELVKVTEEMKSFNAFANCVSRERTNKRHLSARLKRAAEAEKEEKK